VNIGYRPILWHLMRYYAHFGHKDFVLCLGYRGDMIREFFLDYREALSSDFVLSDGGKKIELLEPGTGDWRITFVETGMHSNLGQRLMRVKDHLKNEEMFLANYSDGLSNLPLDAYIRDFKASNAAATFLSVRPAQSFHAVRSDAQGLVTAIEPVTSSDYWINGGFFCLRREIFDHMQPGEELVEQPFRRLLAEKRLRSVKYEGFWAAMDTFKDKIMLDRMEARGDCPWMVWKDPK
jgi:glucose-1-phosphate cytidylyltransferase